MHPPGEISYMNLQKLYSRTPAPLSVEGRACADILTTCQASHKDVASIEQCVYNASFRAISPMCDYEKTRGLMESALYNEIDHNKVRQVCPVLAAVQYGSQDWRVETCPGFLQGTATCGVIHDSKKEAGGKDPSPSAASSGLRACSAGLVHRNAPVLVRWDAANRTYTLRGRPVHTCQSCDDPNAHTFPSEKGCLLPPECAVQGKTVPCTAAPRASSSPYHRPNDEGMECQPPSSTLWQKLQLDQTKAPEKMDAALHQKLHALNAQCAANKGEKCRNTRGVPFQDETCHGSFVDGHFVCHLSNAGVWDAVMGEMTSDELDAYKKDVAACHTMAFPIVGDPTMEILCAYTSMPKSAPQELQEYTKELLRCSTFPDSASCNAAGGCAYAFESDAATYGMPARVTRPPCTDIDGYHLESEHACMGHGLKDRKKYQHTADSAEQCREKCDQHPGCQSFVFKSALKHCALKTVATEDVDECHPEAGACLYIRDIQGNMPLRFQN